MFFIISNFVTCYSKKLAVFLGVLLAVIGLNFENIISAFQHHYFVYDQDGAMHMAIAKEFLENPQWYEHFNPRINTPFGADTHSWTYAITLLLISGTWLFHSIFPMDTALLVWSFILPMLMQAIAGCGMMWAIQIFKPTFYQQLFVILAFLLNPFLSSFFVPLNVDYDFLMITLGIFYWGCLLRLIDTNKTIWAVLTALFASLGLWTSISFIMLFFAGLIFMGVLVLQSRMSSSLVMTLLIYLCAMLAVIIRIEHQHFFTVVYDIVSIVYLAFFLLILAGFVIYTLCNRNSSLIIKLILATVLSIFIFLIMNFFFPGFYHGPYNQVSPYLLQYFFPALSEFHSPFILGSSLTLAIGCYSLIGIGYFYYIYLDNRLGKLPQWLLLWVVFFMTALMLYMYRWTGLALPPAILLVSFFIAYCCTGTFHWGVKLLIVLLLALLPKFLFSLDEIHLRPAVLQCHKQFQSMIEDGFLKAPQFQHDKSILVHSNYGPSMLLNTPFSIVATNDHHNPQGLMDSFNFFKVNEVEAKQIVMKRHLDLILICPREKSASFDMRRSQWLQAMELPKPYSAWRLYRVLNR